MAGDDLSWEHYRYFLARELERLSETSESILDKVNTIERKQVAIETRAKVIGSLYGFGAAAAVELIRLFVDLISRR